MVARKVRCKGKGAAFEREIATKLSLWWSKVGSTDLFWRTHASGARATSRAKRGKKTTGQYGDICATDGRGRKLTKCFTISLKRGYQKVSVQDILDRGEIQKRDPEFEGWIKECYDHCKSSGSISWLLIFKKNRRETLVFMPLNFPMFQVSFLRRKDMLNCQPNAFISMRRKMKRSKIKKIGSDRYWKWWMKNNHVIFCMNFQKFLDVVERGDIEEIVRKLYGK